MGEDRGENLREQEAGEVRRRKRKEQKVGALKGGKWQKLLNLFKKA